MPLATNWMTNALVRYPVPPGSYSTYYEIEVRSTDIRCKYVPVIRIKVLDQSGSSEITHYPHLRKRTCATKCRTILLVVGT